VAGRQHPNYHLHGFVLRSTFLHAHDSSSGSSRLVRRKMQFDDHPHLLGSTAQGGHLKSTLLGPLFSKYTKALNFVYVCVAGDRHLLTLPTFSADLNSKE
jgi:hypothetical protein